MVSQKDFEGDWALVENGPGFEDVLKKGYGFWSATSSAARYFNETISFKQLESGKWIYAAETFFGKAEYEVEEGIAFDFKDPCGNVNAQTWTWDENEGCFNDVLIIQEMNMKLEMKRTLKDDGKSLERNYLLVKDGKKVSEVKRMYKKM